ncbi:MAG: Dabb family protein, partial [Muribaculaceae bacterium]|nr:Dabb family protein [Muribaculaceae bacterium]
MVKHVVTFKFKGTPEERRKCAEDFATALRALPDQIDQLKSI